MRAQRAQANDFIDKFEELEPKFVVATILANAPQSAKINKGRI